MFEVGVKGCIGFGMRSRDGPHGDNRMGKVQGTFQPKVIGNEIILPLFCNNSILRVEKATRVFSFER